MVESLNREDGSSAAGPGDEPASCGPSFDVPSNKYSDLFGLFPAELFDGFEEFVKESRRQSGFGKEPPSWW